MNILVLGGNGFIGSNLVNKLVRVGHEVRVYGHCPPGHHKKTPGVDYQVGEFSDLNSVARALTGMDVVFHLISSSIPSTSNHKPTDDIRNNLVDTVGLLECMRELNVRKIIYISSGGTVYGETEKDFIDEEHPLNPNCSYGIVKLAAEKYLMMYSRLYDFEPVILRASNPYGPGQSKIGVQGLIGTLLFKAIKQESIEIWGDGGVIRDYLYISDLTQACISALKEDIMGIYNVGSGVGYTVNQVIRFVEEVTSTELKVNYARSRAEDVNKVVLDIQKIKNEMSWSPNVSINEGLKKYYTWLQSTK